MFTTHRTQRSRRAAVGFASAAAVFALALTGCSPAADAQTDTSSSAAQNHEATVTATDTWAKATADDVKPGEAMSGVFGVIENHGDQDLTITGLTSDVAGITELHEVVDGKMRKIEGDVTVPAGGSLLLEPGANHIMLMDITEPLAPGDDVTVTLTFSDGTTLDVVALVKDTSGANESYEDMDHGDMDMSGDTDAMDHG
ncbi:copper chaperone PCu(A)C [Leucobacter sp. NPDC015123]|uniref:copper chaperone PCu(A)C n=1 Tax=Leucobacter sp. NPDC015123 TaxID=3364129 RepID=UPI0036F48238